MTELERLREEALLSDEEIRQIWGDTHFRKVPEDTLSSATWRIERAIAQAQLDKALKTVVYTGKSGKVYTLKDLIEKGVIPAKEQSLPNVRYQNGEGNFKYPDVAQRDMLDANYTQVDPRGDQ